MDEIDQAQQNEELFRRNALNKHFGRSPKNPLRKGLPSRPATVHGAGPGAGPRLCADCCAEIDMARLVANPSATRCLDCQEKREWRERRGLI